MYYQHKGSSGLLQESSKGENPGLTNVLPLELGVGKIKPHMYCPLPGIYCSKF